MTRRRLILRRGGRSLRIDVRPLLVTTGLAAAAPAVRNPLVAPDIIGVAGGASLAAVTLIVLGSTEGAVSVPVAALAGALTAGVAFYALAWKQGVHGHRLVLAGIGVAAFIQAGIAYVLTEGRIFEVARAFVWMVGSLNARGWEHVWPLLATLVVLLPVVLALGRRVDVLGLVDDVARSLGVGVERTRMALLGAGVVLTGVAVAASGPIGFVAFLSPHIARRVSGAASAQSLLLAAAGCGAVLVLVADLLGRLLFSPDQIPVGIVTSILAAPYFIFLLRRATRVRAAG